MAKHLQTLNSEKLLTCKKKSRSFQQNSTIYNQVPTSNNLHKKKSYFYSGILFSFGLNEAED